MRELVCLNKLLPRDVFVWNGMRCQYGRTEDDKVLCLSLDYGLDTFYLNNSTMVEVEQKLTFKDVKVGGRFIHDKKHYISVGPFTKSRALFNAYCCDESHFSFFFDVCPIDEIL